MSNRLAELENHLGRRQRARSKPGKAPVVVAPAPAKEKMRSALERMQTSPAPATAPASAPVVAQGLSGRVARWPGARAVSGGMSSARSRSPTASAMNAGKRRARGLDTIACDIPGNFWVLAQPSGNACWATVYTMLKSWRSQREMSIEAALATVGQKWVDIFRADTGLMADDKVTFIASAGLVAQPPQSLSIDGWQNLLRDFGPIWVTTDEAPGQPGGIHARIITGMLGDGSPEGTKFRIVDPSGGRRYEESIAVFIPKFEDEARRASANTQLRIQVVHWQADARSEQRSLAASRSRSTARGLSAAPASRSLPSTVRSRGLDLGAALAAQQRARALGDVIDTRYNVELVPQQTGMSCWAAGFAMIVGWRDQICIDPSEIARASGHWAQYQAGLHPEDVAVMNVWGFVPAPLQTFTVEGFADLLRRYGPLWCAGAEPGPHIRVVTGIKGDGTPDGTMLYINDPWEKGMTSFVPSNRGEQYRESYSQFVDKQSTLARREMSYNAPVYVAHLPRLPAWMNSAVAQGFSHFVGRPLAMEAPSNPENFHKLTSGVWNGSATLNVQGGMAMWFKIRNNNVLGTTIRIRERSGQVKQSIILPASSVEFVFSIFGSEPMGWSFDIGSDSDAFIVTWELWSTWVPGMPPNG